MSDRIEAMGEGFWNIRGSFRIGGLLDVGTQSSLVRLRSGGFVLLDSYTLQGDVLRTVNELTDGGRHLEAILNLHPFHTLHVSAVQAQFPRARLYGTARHRRLAPDLPWQPVCTDDPVLHQIFADDFVFTVPRGVDFIPQNESLHFSSVLAFHRESRTLHVDDTLNFMPLPLVGGLGFHPTLGSVLERRAGAVADFRAWSGELLTLCASVDRVCTAHTRALPAGSAGSLPGLVQGALRRTERTLRAHEQRWG